MEKSKHPSISDLSGTAQTVSSTQSSSKSSKDQRNTHQNSDLTDTDSPALLQVSSKLSSALARKQRTSHSDSEFSDQHSVNIFVEEREQSDQDPDVTVIDPDQTLSEEQTYGETMRGIRSFMGWTHIPDMDAATSTSETTTPLQDQKLRQPVKSRSKCPWMNGSARR